MTRIEVTPAPFDVAVEIEWLTREGAGAIATFIGIVRGDGDLTALTLEHYPAMTGRALERIAVQASERWPLSAITIYHRIGVLVPADKIVFVGTSSAHRHAALESCAFLIDRLKTQAPFWKHEAFADGRSHWVEARGTDDAAASRWG